MSSPVIIYHGGRCLDGFGSAYAAWSHFHLQRHMDAEYVAASHGQAPPDCAGRDVYILDFSYKRPEMKALCQSARQVVVLDHHVSAKEDLEGLEKELDNLELIFDMKRSGAMMSWQYFHRDPAPRLIALIQDRDLWRFELADTEAINSALLSYPLSFDHWHRIAQSSTELTKLAEEGQAINRYRDQMVVQYKSRAVFGEIAGYRVPVVNCPLAIISELVGQLAKGHPFAAGYNDKGVNRTWSLRSTADGENVAAIAVRFGGGGHPRAAGFSTALPSELLRLQIPKAD